MANYNMAGGLSVQKHLVRVVLAVLWATQPASAGSNSFYYNGDVECSYPFSSFSITGISCMTSTSYTYVEGYNNKENDYSDDESVCTFGDTMNVVGSTYMDGSSVKKFSIILNVCYGGSAYVGYNPTTCKSYRKLLDLTDYARLSEAEYYDEEVDESEYYLQPGQYQWRAGFKLPKKSFYFSTGRCYCCWNRVVSLTFIRQVLPSLCTQV